VSNPLIKNRAEKCSELQWFSRPLGNLCRAFPVWTDQVKPIRSGQLGYAFHDRNELHVTTTGFAQESVHLERSVRVLTIHHGQSVELDTMLPEIANALHDRTERRLSAFVATMQIVQFTRSVD
jgi:hypothetical protein